MATLYFNNSVDNDWNTLGNWWLDDTFTTQATSLPTSADDVVFYSVSPELNSGSEPTVASLSVAYIALQVQVTVTGTATFTGYQIYSNYAAVTGNCVFSGGYYQQGSVTGNCTFNTGSRANGIITGDCEFNDASYASQIANITGNCVFNDSSYSDGAITGDCTFSDQSYNFGSITGNCTFNDAAFNAGSITGNATFTASLFEKPIPPREEWTAGWGVMFAENVNPVGVVSGAVTFSSATPVLFRAFNWWQANAGSWIFSTPNPAWEFTGYCQVANSYIPGYCTFRDSSVTVGGGGITLAAGATFNDSSYCNSSTVIGGDATFNDTSSCGNIVYCGGNMTFNHNTTADNIQGCQSVTFNHASRYDGLPPAGAIKFNDSSWWNYNNSASTDSRTPWPIPRGINGSSILGIV